MKQNSLVIVVLVLLTIVAIGAGYYVKPNLNVESADQIGTSTSTHTIVEKVAPVKSIKSQISWDTIANVPTAKKHYSTFTDKYNYVVEFKRHGEGSGVTIRDRNGDPADRDTFVVGNGPGENSIWFAKDKSTVYYYGIPIPGADPATFTPVLDTYREVPSFFAMDANHVYRVSVVEPGQSAGTIVPDADPKTFVSVGWVFAKDAHHVWSARAGEGLLGLQEVQRAAPATFTAVLLDGKTTTYFKDAYHVYYLEYILEGADPDTFVVDGRSPIDPCPQSVCPATYLAHDNNQSYRGGEIVE